MHTDSGILKDASRSAGRLLPRAVMVVLVWLFASVQAAAFWALFALVIDAAGWSPAIVSEPMARLKWIVLLGAVTGAGQTLDKWKARQRTERA